MRILQATSSPLRHVRVLAGLLMAVALFLIPAARPPATQALGKIIDQQNISNTGTVQSEAPQISVGGGVIGTSWGERTELANGRVGTDTTTIGTPFPSPTFFNVIGTKVAYQWPDTAMDTSGNMHVAYIEGNSIYYKVKPKGGSLSSPRFVASSDFPNPVRIAVGGDGTIWIVWRNGSGSSVFYKRSNDGVKWTNGSDGGVVASQSGNMISPDVAVGSDNIAHVVWSVRGDAYVADWNGTKFSVSAITTDGAGNTTFDQDPAITVDPQNTLHAVWRKKLNADGTNWAIYYARRPAGSGWQNYTSISITNGDAGYAPEIGSDQVGNLYVTYSTPVNAKQRQVIFWGKTPTGQWDGPLPLPLFGWDSRSAVTGSNGDAHILYQTEQRSDQGEIRYVRVAFASSASIGATPKIDGGSPNNRDPLSVSFESVFGDPKEIRWRWGAAPSDAASDSNGWQTFTNPISIGLPANIDKTVCQNLTLFTQVRNGTLVQTTASQVSLQFDKEAQANVVVENPFLAGLPKATGAQTSDPYTSATDGAYDGDPGYTRMPQFFLSITNNNDCSGLASFIVPASSTSDVISNGSYEKRVTLPQGSFPNPGTKMRVDVVVSDRLGNITNYPNDIIYDPANTNQNGTPNTDGLPVLANGGSVAADNVNSIIRKLTFQNISVNDTVYGQFENLPAGRQFWGAWIANSTTPVANPNSANLQWFPVHVPTPGASFTLTWNLFNGIAPDQRTTGTYYIYVKFLDGAGNATVNTLPAAQAQLSAGFSVPTLYLTPITK